MINKNNADITPSDISEYTIQLESGSSATTYEPYTGGQPSPNPDYPQEIEVGRGKNLLKIEKQTKVANGITTISNEDGSLTSNGTTTKTYYELINDIICEYPSGTYTFSISKPLSHGLTLRFYFENSIKNYRIPKGSKSVNFTTTEKCNKYRIYAEDGLKIGTVINETVYPKLEKGSVATSYLPYNTIEVKSTGKNLLKNIAASQTINGITFTVNDDGTVLVNGTATATAQINLVGTRQQLYKGKYIVSGCPTGGNNKYRINVAYYSLSNAYIGGRNDWGNGNSLNFESEDVLIAVSIIINANQTVNNLLFEPMIRLATITNDTYEPYKESSITYNLGDNFLADKDYIENGVLNKHIGKVVLNGSETWGKDVNLDKDVDYFYIWNIGIDSNNIKTAISNRFILGNRSTQGIWATTVFCITINKKYTGITSSDTKEQRIDKFKTWLSENPVTVYYELTTPEQIQLETTGELRTFEG